MSYKDNSNFGSRVTSDSSGHPVRKVKTNADVFEEHGMPWDQPEKIKRPKLSPDGLLRISRRAHLFRLMNNQDYVAARPVVPVVEVCHPDKALTLSERLAKEQNTAIPSISVSRGSLASPRDPLIQARANINNRRGQHLVKVK